MVVEKRRAGMAKQMLTVQMVERMVMVERGERRIWGAELEKAARGTRGACGHFFQN